MKYKWNGTFVNGLWFSLPVSGDFIAYFRPIVKIIDLIYEVEVF